MNKPGKAAIKSLNDTEKLAKASLKDLEKVADAIDAATDAAKAVDKIVKFAIKLLA